MILYAWSCVDSRIYDIALPRSIFPAWNFPMDESVSKNLEKYEHLSPYDSYPSVVVVHICSRLSYPFQFFFDHNLFICGCTVFFVMVVVFVAFSSPVNLIFMTLLLFLVGLPPLSCSFCIWKVRCISSG